MKSKTNELDKAPGFEAKLTGVSSTPGVYLMKDAGGNVLYIGKAQNLKKRLASYASRSRSGTSSGDVKTDVLLKKVSDVETILTGSEKEALILESNLIKRHRPRYNVILKDDKRYPSLRLDIQEPYPILKIVRKVAPDGALYFGPFSSAGAVRKTLKSIHKTFKLRKCKTKHFKNRSRPCINHQMGLCLAPCCLDVEKSTYDDIIKEVVLFLKGRTPDLIKKVKREMMSAAAEHDFERAVLLRDKMFALKETLEKQVAVTSDHKDRDVFGIARSHDWAAVTVMTVRAGYLLGTRHFNFPDTIATDSEIIAALVRQFYDRSLFVPKEILVPVALEDSPLLAEILRHIKGKKVTILEPKRGEKRRLINMASQNAASHLKALRASYESDNRILIDLRKKLRLDRVPSRIECFDISSTAGKTAVAGMVTFYLGRPEPSSYRRYIIKTADPKDDYACMFEVLNRRYKKGEAVQPLPDILMVDGGKGQLNIAASVISSLGLEKKILLLGIAKKDGKKGESQDKVYQLGQVNPVNLGRQGEALLLLQRIRDEAHRYAITFHRKRRDKRTMHSALDSIPGVGRKRKAILLKHFQSVEKIRAATREELRAVPGINRTTAEAVEKALAHDSAYRQQPGR